jgi:hypothetical protein
MDELEALALAAAAKKKQGPQYDAMGFPVQPAGGSSVNPQAVGEMRDKGRALATAVADGASFGLGDNIAGVIEGTKELAQGRSFGRGYGYGVDVAREGIAQDRAENPGLTMAGNIVGMGVQGVAAAPLTGAQGPLKALVPGSGVLPQMGRGGIVGGIEGGLQGAGFANGQDTTGQAIRGMLMGAGAGIAAPAVVAGAGAVKNSIMDPVTGVLDSLRGTANVGKANRALAETLRQSGKTEQEIIDAVTRAAREGQPEYRMMDALGVSGQRRASGVTRAGGDAATEIADFLERRQLDQGDRVGGFIDDAFGTRGTTAAQTRDSLTAARSAVADTAYGAARGNAAPVDVRGALGVIDARIGGMSGSGIAGDSIDGKLASYRSRLAGDGAGLGPDVTGAELSDFDRVLGVKQSIQDDIGAAVRAGRNNEARELGKLVSELDAALEASSDMYRAANDGFRDASRVIESVDTGAGMAARGRAADNVPQFLSMTPEQQAAARVGYGDNLLNRLEAVTAPTANRAKPLLSTKRVQEADAMALGPTIYRDRLARENAMWETQNRALGGSRTADNLQDIDAMQGLAGGALDVARSAGNFQFGDMVAKIGGMLGPMARGQTDETRQLIARALMSDDPAKALAPVLRQELTKNQTHRVIEALIRQPMREGGEALGQ